MIKAILLVLATTMVFTVKVHASNVHVKEAAAPPTYLVEGKQVGAADATIAVLQGKQAMKCTEMQVEASRSGLALKAKKQN